MPDHMRRCESLLFNYETTSRSAYRDGEIRPVVLTTYKGKKRRPRPSFVPLKDIHALTAWRDPNIPFDLYHRPDGIIRRDPRNIQKKYEKPLDVDRAKVQRTRPRVVMTPALALDDVNEPCRQMFMDYIYTSETSKALKDAAARIDLKGAKSPLSEVYAKARPLDLPQLMEPYVSPEWRMDSVSWDNKQLRSYCEPTKTFWLNRPPPVCGVCTATATRDEARKRKYR